MQSLRNQYLATICVNFATIAYGIALGWSSPSIPVLLSEESPLITGPITKDEASWISSIFCIGGAFGALCSGPLMAKIGRIRLLMMIGPAQIVSWLLISFAENVYYLYLSRFITGCAGGGIFVVLPVFVSEIADASVRGKLGTAVLLSSNSGIVLAFVVGALLHYTIVPFMGLAFSVTFLTSLCFLHESPQYLMAINQLDKAEKASVFYYGGVAINTDDKMEKQVETKVLPEKAKSDKITAADLRDPATIKGISICFITLVISQLCGVLVLMNYTASIFKDAGVSIDPNYAACVVAGLQVLGSYISTLLIERLGRKFLIIVSSFGSGLFLFLMGGFDYFKNATSIDVSDFNWIPLLSLSSVCFISATGMVSLPYIVSAEVLPEKLRGAVIGNASIIQWLVSFVYFLHFNTMLEWFNMYGSMCIFGSICMIYTAYTYLFVPETKGKTLDEIRKALSA